MFSHYSFQIIYTYEFAPTVACY